MRERFFDSHLDAAEFASTLLYEARWKNYMKLGDEIFLLSLDAIFPHGFVHNA